MKVYKFVCPECGCEGLDWYERVLESYKVAGIFPDGEMDFHGNTTHTEKIIAIRCANYPECKFKLSLNKKKRLKWFKDNCELVDE
jgi:hypothetical protein